MKLTEEKKTKLLRAANQVYMGYVALDFCKTTEFEVGDGSLTLEQICKAAILERELKLQITVNGQIFILELTEEPKNFYTASLQRPVDFNQDEVTIKPLNAYAPQEALNLLSQQSFCFYKDPDDNIHVENRLSDQIVIGGSGKVDLYCTHLVTLKNIIEKISLEEDISSLLVAMATGSGKTYVQALWMLVLYMSGNDAIFAVPDNLVHQFCDDLESVLPSSLCKEILRLRDRENNTKVAEVFSSLTSKPNGNPCLIVSSSELLLDDYYQQLLDLEPGRVFLNFDEQHLLMKTERRRVRLLEISKQMLSMFLTATPNEETYQLSGNNPVAIMSSAQKQAAGQGQFPVLFTENARNISDRNKLQNYRFWTAEFWQNMYYGLLLRFTNAIEQEQSSAATSIVESLPFYFYRKPDERDARWRMQVPMARKMLCIIDDNETLVNFCYSLENSKKDVRTVYRNGNLVDRNDVSNFFQVTDVDYSLVSADLSWKRSQHVNSLNYDEREICRELVSTPL